MKIRNDFVTNSSSSAFICLRVDHDYANDILIANDMTRGQIVEKAFAEGLDEVELNGNNIVAAVGEYSIEYVGRTLDASDLEEKTVSQLKEELAETIRETYGINIGKHNIEFDYGEISR